MMCRGFYAWLGVCLIVIMLSPIAFADSDELVIGIRAEPPIDPHIANSAPDEMYSSHLFSKLLSVDPKFQEYPGLAESWRQIDDVTWEFKLRKAKFHDGTECTAEDVVFSFDRVKEKGAYIRALDGVVSYQAIDPSTIVVKLSEPKPNPLVNLQGVLVVSKAATDGATHDDFLSGKAVVGTGPYKFVEYVPGKHLVLERFEEYWGEQPAYKRVIFRFFNNDAARVAALLGGVVDIIGDVPVNEVDRVKKRGFTVFNFPTDRIVHLVFNNTLEQSPYLTDKDGKPLPSNPLKDLRVRQAIAKGIYRPMLIKQVMRDLAFPATQIVPEGFFGYNPDVPAESYDPQGARQLLAEAGYPDGLGITLHGPNDRYVNDAKICNAIGQMLSTIGVDVTVKTMPRAEFFPMVADPKKELAFYLIGWGGGGAYEGLMEQLHTYDPKLHWGEYNGGYSNPEFDQLVEEAMTTLDSAKQEELLKQAMAVVYQKDIGAIALHLQTFIVAAKEGLTCKLPYSGIGETFRAMDVRPVE